MLEKIIILLEKKIRKENREKENDVPQEQSLMEEDPLNQFWNVAPLTSGSEDEKTVDRQSSRASTPPSPVISFSQIRPEASEPKAINKKKTDDSNTTNDESLSK